MEVTGSNMKNIAVLTEDEYREFNDRVAILSQKGYDLVHEVHYQEDKTFKISANAPPGISSSANGGFSRPLSE